MSDLMLAAPSVMEREAVISPCQQYRYLLRRAWDHTKPRGLFVMLNPSTADASIDDATIRSCIRLAKTFGHGSFEVVNLFAYRSTDPDMLTELDVRPIAVGPFNDAVIEAAINRCDIAICAWGAHSVAERRQRDVTNILLHRRPAIFCLGVTKSGAPKHPLYIKSGTPLVSYRP